MNGEEPFKIQPLQMYPSVTAVVPREDFMLDITFSNGESGVLDMKPYLGFGIFNRLKDRQSFEKVTVNAVVTSITSIRVKSTPHICNSSVRASNLGAFLVLPRRRLDLPVFRS